MGAEQSSAAGSSAASAASLSKDSEPAVETPTVSSSVMKPVAELAPGQTPSALVVVGPSGVGKGTLIKLLMDGSDRFGFSTSHTTRQPRPGEKVATGRRWGERSLSPRTKGTTVYQMIDPHFPTPIRSMECTTTSPPRSSSARRLQRASSSNTPRCMAGAWRAHGDDRVLHGRCIWDRPRGAWQVHDRCEAGAWGRPSAWQVRAWGQAEVGWCMAGMVMHGRQQRGMYSRTEGVCGMVSA